MSPLTVFSLAVLYMVQTGEGAVYCDRELVKQAWEMCNEVYQPNGDDVDVKDMCQNSECYLQCYTDAVGNCEESDEFLDQILQYDTKKWNVYYRAACSDETLAMELSGDINNCPSNQTCPDEDFASSLDSNLLDLYKTGKYEDYKKLLCSTYSKGRNCISVKQSENCSAASARFYENILKIGGSISFCENSDIQHLYTAYGGDAKCINPKVDSKCFPSKVKSEISKCSNLWVQAVFITPSLSNISEICQSLECDAKCYADAVGKCYMKDENVLMDPLAMKVSNRAACERKDELHTALKECELSNKSCSTEFITTLSLADDLFGPANYSKYRQLVCSAASKFRECVKYDVTGSCTAEMTTLLHDIMEVSYSFAGCGPQNHAFFSKYGYDTECDVSSSGKNKTNMLLISIFMFLFVLIHY